MAVTDTVTIEHATIDPETGAVEISFNHNGFSHPHVFASVSDIPGQWGSGMPTPEHACYPIYSWWLSRDPTCSNFDLIRGKTFEFDYSAQNSMKIVNT